MTDNDTDISDTSVSKNNRGRTPRPLAWWRRTFWNRLTRRRGIQHKKTQRNAGQITTISVVPHFEPSPPTLDLSIIIVSHNTRDTLIDCLASIEASLSTGDLLAEIIVVDDGSNDGSSDLVSRRFPNVIILDNGHTAGRARARNIGVRASRGRLLAFVDPHTTIEGDALGILINHLETHPHAGVVGPLIRKPDGSVEASRRRFPTRRTAFINRTRIKRFWPASRAIARYYVRDRSNMVEQTVDWLTGECLVTRREILHTTGLFDERFFMFSSEAEWCYRVGQAGRKIIYLPNATVRQIPSTIPGEEPSTRRLYIDTDLVLLYENFFGRRTAHALHWFLLFSCLLRIFAETGKGILGHRRSLRWRRVAMYSRVFLARLRSGMPAADRKPAPTTPSSS